MKTLILKSDRGSFEKFYIKNMQTQNVYTTSFFKKMGKIRRYISIFFIQKLKVPFSFLWYGNWKRDLNKYNNVIIFDRNYNWNIIKFIYKRNPKCRIIVWYWNPLATIQRVPKKYRKYCEEWSFDRKDCDKYGLKYNVQFSFQKIFENKETKKVYELYFVGYDKGRLNSLLELKKKISISEEKVKFIVVKDKNSKIIDYAYSSPVSYEENLDYLSKSDTIIEFVQGGQNGITVRCIEALFSMKKIITNNKEIIKYNFYNKNNIFVYDEKSVSIKQLEDFLKAEYNNIDLDIMSQYDFSYWLKNFHLDAKI